LVFLRISGETDRPGLIVAALGLPLCLAVFRHVLTRFAAQLRRVVRRSVRAFFPVRPRRLQGLAFRFAIFVLGLQIGQSFQSRRQVV